MLFNSIDFAIFLPIVFLIYWFITNKNLSLQNLFIVVASYFFYGWLDWKCLSLIFISTVVDYLVGLGLSKENNQLKRKILLLISIIINLSLLGFFKYYNFFLDNFINVFSLFGKKINTSPLDIILPVGISFYTFQTLSYSIDVYRKKLDATRDFIKFSAFVSFFPQLVAGPIEKAKHLLPQFDVSRKFNYNKSVDGMKQILWGLFKKILIADNCAKYANLIFNNSDDYTGSTLIMGAVFFTIQIYSDFSAYSDIAIGTAKLFGFELTQNFAFPFFSRNVVEFWRRWHISLHNWFTDYLYIPLGGNKGSKLLKTRNIFIVFIVGGFWHGARWNYVIWGFLTAIYFLPYLLQNNYKNHKDIVAQGKYLPTIKELLQMIRTFALFAFSMIIFRLNSLTKAYHFITNMFLGLTHKKAYISTYWMMRDVGLAMLTLIAFFILIEWAGREGNYAIENIGNKWNKPMKYVFYYLIVMLIVIYGSFSDTPFIYFQF